MERFDPKQPSEAYHLIFDFTKDFTDDEGVVYETGITITSVDVINNDTDADVKATVYDATKDATDGLKAKVWFKSGTDLDTYKWTVKVTGSTTGEIYELDGLVSIKAI